VGRQLRADSGQVQNGIDLADEVIVRNHLVEVELIEQPAPVANRTGKTESRPSAAFNGLLQHYLPEADIRHDE
jgi:hypothetical protein